MIKSIRGLILLAIIAPHHAGAFADDFHENTILNFQEKVDVAIQEADEIKLYNYLSDNFIFSISGCQEGRFSAFTITKHDFIKSLKKMESETSNILFKQRGQSAFRLSQSNKKAQIISRVTEKVVVKGKEKVTLSVEDIRYSLANENIKIELMLIEIKERYIIERDLHGEIRKNVCAPIEDSNLQAIDKAG